MQVFNTYFKVLKKHWGQISVYLVVFISFAVMFATMGPSRSAVSFEQEKVPVAVIDRDGSPVSKSLKAYLGKVSTLVELPDEKERLQDELFYRNVNFIAILPQGFGDAFAKGGGTIETVKGEESAEGYYVQRQMSAFLNTLARYQKAGYSLEDAVKNAEQDSSVSTSVQLQQTEAQGKVDYGFSDYFRFLAYIDLVLMILGVSIIMMTFYRPDLRRRSSCSPLSTRRQNLQLMGAGMLFAVGCWVLLCFTSLPFYGFDLLRVPAWWLAVLNTLVFTAVGASIGFCVGVFVKGESAQTAAANVISLATSFLSGVFVPQEFLSEGVLRVSVFLPNYWFVKLNDALPTMGEFTAKTMGPVWQALGIQLAFAVAIASVSLLVSREKSKSK